MNPLGLVLLLRKDSTGFRGLHSAKPRGFFYGIMMSKKDIFWFKCVPADFLSDIDLQCMDAEQRGVAFWLWMNLYCNNGSLKYNPKRLACICGSNEEVLIDVVDSKFQVVDGFLRHKRVDDEIQESQARHDKALKASKARWDKKKKANPGQLSEQCTSNALASIEQCQYNTIQHSTVQTDNNNIHTPTSDVQNEFDDVFSGGKFSLAQCKDAAFKTGITEEEAEAAYHFYNSQGWKKSNGISITNIESALVSWKNNSHKFGAKNESNPTGPKKRTNKETSGIFESENGSDQEYHIR